LARISGASDLAAEPKVARLLNGRAPGANRGLSLYHLERVRETNASGPEM